ncbi:phage integrase SAM-like domain-containing protein [Adhaeribacter aquaticus]|uniref:phage integrase SAM-like domain-containing protein n=1 Tax=Adhaeribacter aquaticus TaxID=299567 RepID=UPI00316ACFF6
MQKFSKNLRLEVEVLTKQDQFSLEALNKRLSNATGDTVNTAFKARIDDLTENGKVSTSDWYKYTLRSIALFAGQNIKFSQITIDWLKKYEKHLLKENKSYTTISMYMRALQVIVNEAKEADIIKPTAHPFGKGKYEIPQHEGRNIALTISQVSEIVKYEPESETIACAGIYGFSPTSATAPILPTSANSNFQTSAMVSFHFTGKRH